MNFRRTIRKMKRRGTFYPVLIIMLAVLFALLVHIDICFGEESDRFDRVMEDGISAIYAGDPSALEVENKYKYTSKIEGYTFEEVDEIGQDLYCLWKELNTNKIISETFPKDKAGFEYFLKQQINEAELWDKKIAYVWSFGSPKPTVIEFDKLIKTDIRYIFFGKDPMESICEVATSYVEFVYVEKYYKNLLCFEGVEGQEPKKMKDKDYEEKS